MTKDVKLEWSDATRLQSFCMLLSKTGCLYMAALGLGREDPAVGVGLRESYVQHGPHPISHANPATRSLPFSPIDPYSAVPDVVRHEPEALFGTQSAIDQ